MSSLVQDDLTRASTFFALAFGLTALGGLAMGDLRLGVEYGLLLGAGFAIFAYFFIAPADSDVADSDVTDPDAADPDVVDPESDEEMDSESDSDADPGADRVE